MNERRMILEFFEQQKEYVDRRIAEGIEKYRKGDVEITVTDSDGTPVSNAKIKAKQKNHEFRFGANIFMLDELETEEKNQKYKDYFADVFNMATLPFYWDTLEPEHGKTRFTKESTKVYRRPAIDLCIEFCEKHDIEPREHGLAYASFYPKWLSDASVEEVKRESERRIFEIAERYADKIRTIEVTNEMDRKNAITSFYEEPDFINWNFKTAEKYFPQNQLAINEWNRLWEDRCRFTDKYYSYIEAAMLKGARIDAIGMQFHLFNKRENEYAATRKMLNPQRLYKCMDLYAHFGKPLQITEVTIPAYSWEKEDEDIQAELLEKLYSIWWSHPNVEQIIYWNLVDGYAYVNSVDPDEISVTQGDMTVGENYYYGGLLRFDMTPKPAFYKLKELIQKKWHTETELITDENGKCCFRGFYGDYEIEAERFGDAKKAAITISSKKDNKIKVVL